MSSQYGYIFYFGIGSDLLTLPITPSELTISSGSNNKVITLINEGDVNILKLPSLTEIEFEARFPMRKYPYSRDPRSFESYLTIFTEVKEKKIPFQFIVARATPSGEKTWSTNIKVALEDVSIKESAAEGDDVLVTFKLKQYKHYGVTYLKQNNATTTSTSPTVRPTSTPNSTSRTYVVKAGDTLWAIAKKFYGNGAKWRTIYNANKTAIENDAKKHGKNSSREGHWIWPGLTLVIPNITASGSYTGNNATKQTLK
jgi:LysM repeat protein